MASTHEMEALAASAARQSLLAYAIGMIPRYETPAHLELLAEKLEAVERDEIKRLMVFMPPRHGKSNLTSEVFPAWYLGRKPDRQVMFTTYAQDLADGFGRKVRNAVADPRHVRSFPDSVLSEDSQSAKRFNTTAGGVYYAVGAGGPVTGRGADCMVEGTLVQTAAGAVPVENLKVGAASGKILSLNQMEMRLEYRELQAIASREADGLYRITTESGRVLEVTGNHRVFVGGEYREASSISPGDVVVCLLQEGASHRQLAHEQFRVEPSDAMRPLPQQVARGEGWQAQCDVVAVVERVRAKARVYDIQVEENQNLFANGVCVHNCLILDDPLKNREEADSKLIRDKLWDWYASTAYTRLMPGGAVVLVQCMVGDTQVMLADGTQKELRDIRPGDLVATYEDGRLTASRVVNWANQGPDKTHSIKTSSGTIVRANARHPFLVDRDGSIEWIQVCNLAIGDKVVRVIGASGAEFHAPLMGAKSQPSAKGFAAPTTTSNCGQAGTDRRPSTLRLGTRRASSAGTESTKRNTTGCSPSRAGVAPSAECRQRKTCERIGAGSSALTTATTPASQGGCYATTATSQLDTSQTRQSLSAPQSTCDFTTDPILEIVEAGVEDVFDIQVERTENFIANGLVSHNTRWHEDDLAGRLLNGPEQWEVVNLPALAEDGDELGREPGEALWPERYDEHALERIRSTIGEREFIALYQQRPAPLDGALFRRDWIKRGKAPRAGVHVAMGVDLALSTKTSADYTAIVVMSRDEFGKLYVLDAVRERVDFPGALRLIRQMAEKWNPRQIAIEQVAYQAVVVQELLRQTTLPIKGVAPDKDKVTRAQPLALRYEQGLVSHEQLPSWFEDELLAFPQCGHDDSVDALVYAYQAVMRMTRYDDGISTAVARYEALDPEMGY